MLVADAKIILVIPYFGQWPAWINYFIESCAKNPDITWLIYTDCGEPEAKADNIIYHHLSFDAYKAIVSERLGINFNPDSAYKLCDLKPALGLVHTKDIEAYDYWGFGDIDVVYGQIKNYLTPEMLEHNLISFHQHRISGHLCLLKNTKTMREAFMRFKGWEAILVDKSHRCFDEKHFNSLFIRHKNWPEKLRKVLYYPRYLMRTAYFEESYSTSFGSVAWVDGSFNFPETWHWNKGLLTVDGSSRTFPYVHFLYWKHRFSSYDAPYNNDYWRITSEGFSC